jgi:hypothetical protein
MEQNLRLIGIQNHFDVQTGVRSARAIFESTNRVLTGNGMQPHTRVEITVDGAVAGEIERLKNYTLKLEPLTPVVVPVVSKPIAGDQPSPDLTQADVTIGGPRKKGRVTIERIGN